MNNNGIFMAMHTLQHEENMLKEEYKRISGIIADISSLNIEGTESEIEAVKKSIEEKNELMSNIEALKIKLLKMLNTEVKTESKTTYENK